MTHVIELTYLSVELDPLHISMLVNILISYFYFSFNLFVDYLHFPKPLVFKANSKAMEKHELPKSFAT